jgi:ABC-2 type transport system permease protein
MIRSLAGTGALTRFALRRDRIMMPAWIYLVLIGVGETAYVFARLYKTSSARAGLAASGEGNPALLFLYGRLNGTSVGALTAWRYGVWAALFAVLMTIFIVTRHTRADEETGRLELIGSARVGRQAPLAAAVAVAVTANLTLIALLCAALPIIGLPAAGSAAFALAIGSCGLAFTGISAVTAQLASGARGARGLAIGALGLSFLLRAIGDSAGASGPAWLTWALPLGWTEMLRPFGATRWWVLALPLGLCALGIWSAFALNGQRDLGAGLLPGRPGRATASAALRGPLSLAWRLQWTTLAGWAGGYVFIFATCGAAAKGIGQLFGTSGALRAEFARIGGQSAIVNAYLAALMLLAGLVASAYGVSIVLRLSAQETGQGADLILSGPVGRIRWALGQVLVAALGMALLLTVAGVATGIGYGLRAGGAGPETARMLGAALVQLPAALVLAAVAVAAFGVVPRACAAVGWTALGLVTALSLFGPSLQLPRWAIDISPFAFTPRLPGGAVTVPPLLWLSALAAALAALGLAALRGRDMSLGTCLYDLRP